MLFSNSFTEFFRGFPGICAQSYTVSSFHYLKLGTPRLKESWKCLVGFGVAAAGLWGSVLEVFSQGRCRRAGAMGPFSGAKAPVGGIILRFEFDF